MNALEVHLQEGFQNDDVVISTQRETIKRAGVSTRLQTGLAALIELEMSAGPQLIDLRIPSKNLQESVTIDANTTPFLGVSIADGRLLLRPSPVSFGYV